MSTSKESGAQQASKARTEQKVRNLEDKPLTTAEGLALKRADAEASRAEIDRLRKEYSDRVKAERKFTFDKVKTTEDAGNNKDKP